MSEQKEQIKTQKTKKILRIIAMVLTLVLVFTCGYFSKYIFDPAVANSTIDLIRLIDGYGYVLDENGNEKALTKDDYLKALASGVLDQYSTYYTEQEYEEYTSQRSGSYNGFGFSIYKDAKKEPIAVNVIGDSPADRAGVRAGDKIISATFNNQTTEFNNSKELSEFLNLRTTGDVVTFNVERGEDLFSFTVEKANYSASYVSYFDSDKRISFHTVNGKKEKVEIVAERIEELGENTALIRLDSFYGDVASQLEKALNCMKNNNRTNLILDLRDNGGGDMEVLTQVASRLIYNGGNKTLIAFSDGKVRDKSFEMEDGAKNDFIAKISVLANDGTASATEALIGAMLHYGEKFSIDNLVIEKNEDGVATTYGKGIMQTTYRLIEGGALKLTTAKLLWPDKQTCVHLKGISPKAENATEKGMPAVIRAVQILN